MRPHNVYRSVVKNFVTTELRRICPFQHQIEGFSPVKQLSKHLRSTSQKITISAIVALCEGLSRDSINSPDKCIYRRFFSLCLDSRRAGQTGDTEREIVIGVEEKALLQYFSTLETKIRPGFYYWTEVKRMICVFCTLLSH